jgi:DNA-binding transcriptional ArsR family regulator
VQGGYGQYVLPTAGMSSGPPDGASGRRDLARIGTLVSDQARCRMLLALGDGRALSASVLAAEAGVTAATASSHLHKLTAGGLLVVEAVGRRRNYRLAGPEVGALVEALERLAPALPVWSLEQSQRARAHREARVCYDHVAGRLGVEVMRVIVERGHLEPVDEAAEFDAGEVRYAITVEGGAFLEALGVTVPPSRRPVRHHADSTEGGLHLSGALGRALLARFVDLGWLLRQKKQRLQITPDGLTGFDQQFGLDLNQ